MRRLGTLTATAVSVLVMGVALRAGDAVAQQKSLKEQLVGTWKLVSSTMCEATAAESTILVPVRKVFSSTRATATLHW